MIALWTVNSTSQDVLSVYGVWVSESSALSPETSLEVRNGNHGRLVEETRTSVRAWEKNAKSDNR